MARPSVRPPEPTAPELATDVEPRSMIEARDEHVEIAVRDSDLSGINASHARLVRSQLRSVALTAATLRSITLVDVLVENGELSGADLHEASLLRVEFRNCRMIGVNLSEAELRHVRFVDCKLDDANLRLARLDHVWIETSSMVEADLYGGSLIAVRCDRSDLTRADLSKTVTTGLDLRGSDLDALRGASALRNVTIGVEQVVPFAVAVFSETGVRID
jgi:uncharacterized protein YjbI with pentapeptide repeats